MDQKDWVMSEQIVPPVTEDNVSNKSNVNWFLIIVIIVVLLCLMLVCALCTINGVLALLGPAIGNVFSNIMEQIATPIP
jgi:hypothetical protein